MNSKEAQKITRALKRYLALAGPTPMADFDAKKALGMEWPMNRLAMWLTTNYLQRQGLKVKLGPGVDKIGFPLIELSVPAKRARVSK
jgi:hypothetical protein